MHKVQSTPELLLLLLFSLCHLAGLITCHLAVAMGNWKILSICLLTVGRLPSLYCCLCLSLSVSFCAFSIFISSSFPFDNFVKMRRVAALLFTLEFCFYAPSSSSVFLFVCLSFYRLPPCTCCFEGEFDKSFYLVQSCIFDAAAAALCRAVNAFDPFQREGAGGYKAVRRRGGEACAPTTKRKTNP